MKTLDIFHDYYGEKHCSAILANLNIKKFFIVLQNQLENC
jgi:hypothetical protein